MAANKQQRTERPTLKKLREERQKGNVPRSKELSSVLVLGAFLVFSHLYGDAWMQQLQRLLRFCLTNPVIGDLHAGQWLAIVRSVGTATAQLLFVPVGIMAVASVSGNILQGPSPITLKPLKPDFSKMNPFTGIKKVIKLKSFVSLGKALMNMTVFTTIAVFAVRDVFREGLPGAPGVDGTMLALLTIINKVMVRVVIVWLLLALADLLYTRFDYIRNLRMTKQEVKDERKQTEGDPRVKSRIRSKQMEMARTRMMAEVPDATVVITNPTHYAVALRYIPGEMDVPKVVAKGRALIAQRIRQIAVEHDIPIIQDPPLARTLYRSIEVGGFIPAALFRAVAEVLALVLRGDRRERSARGPDEEATT